MNQPPSAYLRYLPAVYGAADSSFVGDYLRIFEKLLTGLDDGALDGRRGIQELLAADVIGNLFYPRLSFLFDPADRDFIPPISGLGTPEKNAVLADLDRYIGVPVPSDPTAAFSGKPQAGASAQDAVQAWLDGLLNWLGDWVALLPDNGWTLDKKRQVIAQILALYRLRGTPQGLTFLLKLLLDLPLPITGETYRPAQDGVPAGTTPISGQVSVTVTNPEPPGIRVEDGPGKGFVVRDRYRRGDAVVCGYFPWLFEVLITLPNAANPDFILISDNVQQVLQLQQRLQQLLASAKPAATRYTIGIVPSMQLPVADLPQAAICSAAMLGQNTLLGLPGQQKPST